MVTVFPQRPRAHQLEAASSAFLHAHVPPQWVLDRPENDYGVDFRLGVARAGQVTGEQLVIQLKACATAPPGETVAVILDVPTLNYLRNMLEVALIVKYVSQEDQAYWLLLKDFTAQPRIDQRTMTIRLPRLNRLTAAAWDEIANHVRAVHYRKLRANGPGAPQIDSHGA